jgi:hypothetical protein
LQIWLFISLLSLVLLASSSYWLREDIMSSNGLTKLVILATAVMLVVFDVIVGVHYGAPVTLSRVLLAWSEAEPRLVFFAGILMGHLFVDTSGVALIDQWKISFYRLCQWIPELLWGVGLCLALIPWPARYPLLVLIAGVISGYFCWPQTLRPGI